MIEINFFFLMACFKKKKIPHSVPVSRPGAQNVRDPMAVEKGSSSRGARVRTAAIRRARVATLRATLSLVPAAPSFSAPILTPVSSGRGCPHQDGKTTLPTATHQTPPEINAQQCSDCHQMRSEKHEIAQIKRILFPELQSRKQYGKQTHNSRMLGTEVQLRHRHLATTSPETGTWQCIRCSGARSCKQQRITLKAEDGTSRWCASAPEGCAWVTLGTECSASV